MNNPDAIIVGSGPNGLAAAIELAAAGWRVRVLERSDRIGGGVRSMELTLPGYTHDVCSAVHPLAISSPFLSRLPLAAHGLEWIQPPVPLAHARIPGEPLMLRRSVAETAAGLGTESDAAAYRRTFQPLVRSWDAVMHDVLGPLRLPSHPISLGRFGWLAWRPAAAFARRRFEGDRARALFAGLAGHSFLPLTAPITTAFGLLLGGAAHAVGWPIPRGGAQRLADAMGSYLRALGGEIRMGVDVTSIDELPASRAVLLDLTPRQVLRVAGSRLPAGFQRRLRAYRYGPAVFKVDWALSRPIPWAAPELSAAGTVHVGGGFDEMIEAEAAPWRGAAAARPFVLLAQPTLFDTTRAPEGRHTAWAYCHVPHGSTEDLTGAVEAQVERFAPGFRSAILARHTMAPVALETHNPNLVGGDINGGVQDFRQAFLRPTRRLYRTPVRGLYICSASTPPGGGVHGMCGYHAARAVLADLGR